MNEEFNLIMGDEPEQVIQSYENSLTTTQLLSLFEMTKEQRISFAENIISQIEAGNVEALKIHIYLKKMESIIEILTDRNEKTNKSYEIAKKYHSFLLSESEKNGKEFSMFGQAFSQKETGVKYDYSLCADPAITHLLEMEKKLKDEIKLRQDFLKTVPQKGMTVLIGEEENGEVVTIFPPAKSSTTSLTCSLK